MKGSFETVKDILIKYHDALMKPVVLSDEAFLRITERYAGEVTSAVEYHDAKFLREVDQKLSELERIVWYKEGESSNYKQLVRLRDIIARRNFKHVVGKDTIRQSEVSVAYAEWVFSKRHHNSAMFEAFKAGYEAANGKL